MANRTYTDFPERKLEKPASPMGTPAFRPGAQSSDRKPSAADSKPPYRGASPAHMSGAGSPRIKNRMAGSGSKTHYK